MAWLTGWNRRKSIIVNGVSAGTQSNYQMKLTVNQGTGTDSTGIIYCGGNLLNDYSDLRFTASDGSSKLYYWIESKTGTAPNQTATVWIQIGSIPTAGTTIYIYYNNLTPPSDGYSSSGINTFNFFDDFLGSTIDSTKWNTVNGGLSYTMSSSIFHPSGSALGDGTLRGYQSINQFGIGYALRGRIYEDHSGTFNSGNDQIGFGTRGYPNGNYFVDNDNTGAVGNIQGAVTINNGGTETSTVWTADTNWHIWEFFRTSTSNHRVIISEGKLDHTFSTSIPTGNLPITLGTNNWGNATAYYDYQVDWVLIRKFVSPEPTFGASGAEELACGNISCNLIVLEILSEQLSRPYPQYIDLYLLDRLLNIY